MLIGIEYKNFSLFLKFVYIFKLWLLGKLFYYMFGWFVCILIENYCMKEKKMDEGCCNNIRIFFLFLCIVLLDVSVKRKRGKELKKWNEQQLYDKMCFDYEKYEWIDGFMDLVVFSV